MKWSLADPPREVPWAVKLRVLFGGFLSQFGWAFFGFGMVFVWAFTANADLLGWYRFGGELEYAQGTVTAGEATHCSVNNSRVYANHYRFTTGDGTEHTAVSYATGRRLSPGRQVRVEYPPGRPETSRIAGMRTSIFGVATLLVLIFPAAGLGLLLPGLWRGLRGIRLLRDGKQAVGRLIDRKPTRARVNNQPVWKLTFEFTAEDGGVFQVSARTHDTSRLSGEAPGSLPGVAAASGGGDGEDAPLEPLVYDPFRPARAALLDALPGGPRIDENGNIRVSRPLRTLAVLIAPAATILGHGVYIMIRYF